MRRFILILLLVLPAIGLSTEISTRTDAVRYFTINVNSKYIYGLGFVFSPFYNMASLNIGKRYFVKKSTNAFYEAFIGFRHSSAGNKSSIFYINANVGSKKTFDHIYFAPYIGYALSFLFRQNRLELKPIIGLEVGIDFK